MNSLDTIPLRCSIPRQSHFCRPRLLAIGFLALACASDAALPPLSFTLSSLYSFPPNQSPQAGLLIAGNGNFYVTTLSGTTNGYGGIFEVTPQGVPGNSILFQFTNGAAPYGPLVQGGDGNLYGTTFGGGFGNNGTIFRVAPSLNSIGTLVTFSYTNGSQPYAPLLGATNGLFYGTTFSGGSNGFGSIFVMRSTGLITNLYSFDWTNGANPYSGLIQGNDGNLYGTTRYGGSNGLGTIFAISLEGVFTNLLSFDGANGADPRGLVRGSDSNFYGVTFSGGTYDLGTLFEMTPAGSLRSTSFNLPNGANPSGPLIQAADGAFYGTTLQGGTDGLGAVFRFLPGAPGASSTNGFTNSPARGAFSVDWVPFDGTAGAYPYGSLVQGSNGNLYGTTSYGGANYSGTIFQVTGFVPVITKPPVSQNFHLGATASFSVAATGSAPLTYQWLFDGAPLTNGVNFAGSFISGATSNELTISPEAVEDAGTYTIVVSNPYGTVTDAAQFAVAIPTITVKPPPPATSSAALEVSGATGGPDLAVTSVQYQLGTTVAEATTTNLWINWSASLTLQPGSNLFLVWSVDPLGYTSRTNRFEIFYYVTNSLVLNTKGLGKIATPAGFNANKLIVGKTYTITAVPAPGNLFSNWTGSITNPNPTLSFLMGSNLMLTANFVTNNYKMAEGVYSGLFQEETNAITPATAGLISPLTVSSSGAYSGKLFLAGSNYTINGVFDVAVPSTNTISRRTNDGGPLRVVMSLELTRNPPAIIGTVSAIGTNNSPWTAQLLAELQASSGGSADYTLLLTPGRAASAGPPGTGYVLITNHLGTATVVGALPDGTAFVQTAPVSESGDLALYTSLYGGAGFLFGWVTNLDNAAPTGNLTWISPQNPAALYPGGFTNTVMAQGSLWTNPAPRTAAITLSDGQLTISGGFLAAPLVYNVSLNESNFLATSSGSATNSLNGSINPKNGLLQLTFGSGNGKATLSAQGAILQNQSIGAGFFTTKTNAGSINLQP